MINELTPARFIGTLGIIRTQNSLHSIFLKHFSKKSERVRRYCLTLGSSMGCGLLPSSVHGVLQARMLEWGSTPISRGSNPGLLHCR